MVGASNLSTRLKIVFILTCFSLVSTTLTAPCGTCRPMLRSVTFYAASNWKLQDSILRRQTTRSAVSCVSICHSEPACWSINYYSDGYMCELNNATHAEHPGDMITYDGAVYYDSDVLTPDFADNEEEDSFSAPQIMPR